MRPEESFIHQPIRSLQTMLRVIAENDPSHPSLVPDGIYGPETVRAVSSFQRMHGLNVSGITDQDTWEAIVAVYEIAAVEQTDAEPLQILWDPGLTIRTGQRHPHVFLIQAILAVLADVCGSIPMPGLNGLWDEQSADSLASFQALAGLPMTGQPDKNTWKQLVLHYPLAAGAQME